MQGTNKVILLGTLGRDPEEKVTSSGVRVTTLNIATNESWKDKNTGQLEKKTEWHRVITFGRLAEIAAEFLSKGSKVYLEGKLQTRKYTDRQGIEKSVTEIVATELKLIDRGTRSQSEQQPAQSSNNFDDDIPF